MRKRVWYKPHKSTELESGGTRLKQLKSTSASPSMTIVVTPFVGQDTLTRCLEALTNQLDAPNLQIIVPGDECLGDISAIRTQYPEVQFLNIGGHRTYAELRAVGVRKARAEIVAITEDHCIPNTNWVNQILEAHKRPPAAIGGAVEKLAPDTALNWAMYLADYLRYMNPVPEGASRHLTDLNVSYKRSALEDISDVWADEFHETVVHETLRNQGETLWRTPQIVVHQQRSLRLGEAIWDRYAFGRLFASKRVSSTSVLGRLIYAGFAISLPALLVARATSAVLSKRRHMKEFIRALPALVLLTTVWAWGEFTGYITGRPESSLTPVSRSVGEPNSHRTKNGTG